MLVVLVASLATLAAAVRLTERGLSITPTPPGGASGPSTWPGKKLSYCYADQTSYDKLHSYVEDAINRWNSAPGGLGGITFDLLNPQVCAAVPSTTPLKIVYKKDAADTTLGYWGPGRVHRLNFDPTPDTGTETDPAGTVAHELGHALGLEHEHQRPDAAQSIDFDCFNLYDWSEFAADEPDMTPLCTDISKAAAAGFSARDYIPYASSDPGHVTEGGIDFDSIMIYGSSIGSVQGEYVLQRKAANGALVPYANPQHPSAGDSSRLRNLYNSPQSRRDVFIRATPGEDDPSVIVDDFPMIRSHDTRVQTGGQCTVNMTLIQLISHMPGGVQDLDNDFLVNATLYDTKGTAWMSVTKKPAGDKNRLKMQGPMPAQLIIVPENTNDYVQFYWGSEAWTSNDKDHCTTTGWGEADGGSDESRDISCKFAC